MNADRITAPLLLTAIVATCSLAAPAEDVIVTREGEPLLLVGDPVEVGDVAPDFTALDVHFQPVTLHDQRGQTVLISVVPSLETRVCTMQTRRFHDALAQIPDDVVVMSISMDLPYALNRFCGREDITDMMVLSDAARREFGSRWGVLIPEQGLLARSVFVVGEEGLVRHVQIVPEITEEPDYEAALAAVRRAAGTGVPLADYPELGEDAR